MPDAVVERSRFLLSEYVRYKLKGKKQQMRDELYMEIRGYLMLWIKNILKKWGKYKDDTDIMSESWFAFMHCIKHYKLSYDNIAGYFYTYTRYYLFVEYAKKENVTISIEELKNILHEFPAPEYQHLECLLTLYQFRDSMPDDTCRLIWDHALLTAGGKMANAATDDTTWCKNKFYKSGFSKAAYYKVRKSYINIIKLILGIK